ALVLLGTAGGLGLLGGMAPPRRAAAEEVIQPSKPATATDKQPERQAAPPSPAAAAVAQDSERIEASHLLVAYQGALRVDPKVTRTKEEAKKRAQEALAKAKKGAAFDKLVAEYSDEPRAAERKGALGSFTRRQMVKPFADAAFALKPGQISDVVETNFGFHVIQRTK
ncbi:MAG TPA: peptidylprolyl isomerase, partial [Polyangiaceae bacterium]|nr:peptidylprolyl isomerase [Polyangiaceae bacterium]